MNQWCVKIIKQGSLVLALFICTGCATGQKNIQPQINALVIANQFNQAAQLLEQGPLSYGGAKNELLYWLDRGMALHLAGKYQESSTAFIQARRLADSYYGRSTTEIAASWLINDQSLVYHGDDHEYVLINIFQALNFALMGNIDEALVEARDVNEQLKRIGMKKPEGAVNVYRDDAFAWSLMGVLWEMEGSAASINDAYIAYQRALKVYQDEYVKNYKIEIPLFLKENLLRTAKAMGSDEYRQWSQQLKLTDKDIAGDHAEVYVIQYAGVVPVKIAKTFVVPLNVTHLTKISLPDYEDRYSDFVTSNAVAEANGIKVTLPTTIAQPIGQIAKQVMKNRIVWLTTKALIRPGAKLLLEHQVENVVREKYGNWQADTVAILGSIYNLASEEADTRSWQTLPNDIRIARLKLRPGTWHIYVDDVDEKGIKVDTQDIGDVELKAYEKKIIVVRSYR